jgi:hypothetical protein
VVATTTASPALKQRVLGIFKRTKVFDRVGVQRAMLELRASPPRPASAASGLARR